jgi:hypothetical protein
MKRIAAAAAVLTLVLCGGAGSALLPRAANLDPGTFAELSSGVVLIRGFTCRGVAAISGTGFLVGRSVAMTARHVVDPGGAEAKYACRVKARVDGRWVAAKVVWWHNAVDSTGRQTDLATLKLARAAKGGDHLFTFRNSSPRIGTKLSAIGYPLGAGLSITQGKLVHKAHYRKVPMLFMNLLGGSGASGSPIVDDNGNVVGVLQDTVGGGTDAYGETTSGLTAGIDIASWWGSGRKAEARLCQVYPRGGIPGCGAAGGGTGTTTSLPSPTTTTTPTSATPPPAGTWPPAGYALWTGRGDYKPGTVAYQSAPGACTPSPNAKTCWGVLVEADTACDEIFVNVDILDANGAKVDSGLAFINSPAPFKPLLAEDDTALASNVRYQVTEIDCEIY